jgi:YaaC-like Protein
MINNYDLFNPRPYGYYHQITSNDGKIKLHELDREFLFIFAISTLARYKVNTWNKMLSGKESDVIIKISEYLQTIQSIFPNFVLNSLLNKFHIFVPIGFMGKDTINRIINEHFKSAGMF